MQRIYIVLFSTLPALSCRAKVLTRLNKSYRDPVQALNYFDRCDASTQATVDSEDASMQATVNFEVFSQTFMCLTSRPKCYYFKV